MLRMHAVLGTRFLVSFHKVAPPHETFDHAQQGHIPNTSTKKILVPVGKGI
jgi:hypothetical protein